MPASSSQIIFTRFFEPFKHQRWGDRPFRKMGDAFPDSALRGRMRALQAQLGDFEIANWLVKAGRTDDRGKQSHKRPRQRRATADRAGGDPNAKGYDDWERECGIHVGLHSKEERSAQKRHIASRKIEADGIEGGPDICRALCASGVGRCYAGLNLPLAATQSPLLIVAKP
jgi:hypothetical protein